MPKELTHWLLADRTLALLSEESPIRDIITSHRNSYLAGAVLPDTLLYLYSGPHSRQALELAHLFHDTDGNSYAPLIHIETEVGAPLPAPQLACLLGVISHMQADIVFHPYVYGHTGTRDIGRHYRLETDIDIFFLQRGAPPPTWLFKDLITPETNKVLMDVCSRLFDPDHRLPPHAIEQALTRHCRIQAMYDSACWKLVAALLSALLGAPYSQQRHLFYPLYVTQNRSVTLPNGGPWQHPVTGESCHQTLDELAEETVARSLKLFELVETTGSLAAALTGYPGENLLTGIHGACLRSMTDSATA